MKIKEYLITFCNIIVFQICCVDERIYLTKEKTTRKREEEQRRGTEEMWTQTVAGLIFGWS